MLGVVFFLKFLKYYSFVKWAVFLLISFLVLSCADNNQTIESSSVEIQTPPELDREVLAEKFPTYDEQLVQVAEVVPNFAGVFFDEGTLTIATVGPVSLSVIQAAVATVLGDDLLDLNAELLRVDHSILELTEWRNSARQLFSEPGVVSLGIDEVRNGIVMGIQNLDNSSVLEQKLIDLGVPSDVVIFEQRDVPEIGANLRGTVSPRVGTIQIGQPNGTSYCTMGFNAEDISSLVTVRGFITNSHCSKRYFLNETDGYFYQPYGGARIGEEYIDPAVFSGGDCPSGRTCRYSDSTFVRYYDSFSSTRKIAATDRAMIGGPRNFEINRYLPVQGQKPPVQNRYIHKIGAKTDHSAGSITLPCDDTKHPTGDWLLCQVRAGYYNDRGDSGSPVFELSNEGNVLGVKLYGIHWGGNPLPGNDAVLSPANNVFRDLGSKRYIYY